MEQELILENGKTKNLDLWYSKMWFERKNFFKSNKHSDNNVDERVNLKRNATVKFHTVHVQSIFILS